MTLPALLAAALPPAPRDWDLLPDDSGTLLLTPATAIDCTGCTLAARVVDADGEPLWADQIATAWIDQAAGSLRIDLPATAVAELAALVSPSIPIVSAGWYRVQIVHAVSDQRRTIIHGPLRARYAPPAPESAP